MKTGYGFTAMTVDEFQTWLAKQTVSRSITKIQLHHTAAPDYAAWNKKPDALYWQNSMKDFHVNINGWADIAQQFTICPDGMIITGRSLNVAPAGITGANAGAICIENIGNFDSDGMTAAQANAIVAVVGMLLKRFNLTTSAITYHAWWTASGGSLGTYVAGKSAKTCPGLKFFGGNTKEAFNSGFKVKVQEYINGTKPEPYYGEVAMNKLLAKKFIENTEIWGQYQAPAQKSVTLALIDKATGGMWKSDEQDTSIHWAQPHVISLCGKKVIDGIGKSQWIDTLNSSISVALFLALIDKATGGMKAKYVDRAADHWARNHLDSLCDKGLITTPGAWTDFESEVSRANIMALVVNAFIG